MDSGDLIYIAFLVISMLFGLFGKKKKKGQKDKPKFDFDLEEMLKKQFNIESDHIAQSSEEFEPITYSKPEPIVAKNTQTPKKPTVKQHKPIHKTSKNLEVQTIGDDNELYDSDFEFDAKQAIIYSEILKRPEY